MDTPNPINSLLQSRRFLLLLLDVLASTLIYLLTLAGKPEMIDSAKILIAIWQPLFVAIIVAYTVDDVQEMKEAAATDRLTIELDAEQVRSDARAKIDAENSKAWATNDVTDKD